MSYFTEIELKKITHYVTENFKFIDRYTIMDGVKNLLLNEKCKTFSVYDKIKEKVIYSNTSKTKCEKFIYRQPNKTKILEKKKLDNREKISLYFK